MNPLNWRVWSIAALLVGGLSTAHAQWGVRWGIAGETIGPSLFGTLVLGGDRDVSGRTSIGLDVIWSFDTSGDVASWDGVDLGTSFVSYSLKKRERGLQYRSLFFLTDGAQGAYIGTQAGFRSVGRALEDSYGSGSNRVEKDRVMVFPVGVRFGVRTALDGFLQDVYISVGYNLGHGAGDDLERTAPYLPEKHRLGGLNVQFGYCMGVGW